MADPLEGATRVADDPLAAATPVGADQPATGFFDAVRQYKAGRINDPSLTPGQKTLRELVWGLVPETPGQTAATGLMTAAGPASLPLRVLGRAAPAVGRVLAGTGAGVVQEALDEGDMTSGALRGAGVTGAIEAGLPAAGKLARSLPWAKGLINRADTARIGRAVGDISPELAGRTTAAELQNLGRVYGTDLPGGGGKQALRGLFADLEARVGRAPVSLPSMGGTTTVSEALAEIARLGQRGYSGQNRNIMTRVAAGMDAREAREQLLNELRGELSFFGPEYVAQYDAARSAYGKGNALLRMLSPSSAYREFPSGAPQLHTPTLQRYISEHRGELLQRLGSHDFDRLIAAVNRGGPLGTRDVLTPGRGGPLDAAMSWLRGQNTGATQAFRVPVATALPNLGSQYAGRAPLSVPDELKALFDILGIAATGGTRQ